MIYKSFVKTQNTGSTLSTNNNLPVCWSLLFSSPFSPNTDACFLKMKTRIRSCTHLTGESGF